uniref:Uncharacterized protein n=1 Tax=Octopus bimaculoides TaxID=37653 RepID=A0A0L8FSW6_OCTBM
MYLCVFIQVPNFQRLLRTDSFLFHIKQDCYVLIQSFLRFFPQCLNILVVGFISGVVEPTEDPARSMFNKYDTYRLSVSN